MGKVTGFLEFERQNDHTIAPLERIKNFEEFHTPLEDKARQQQGARCMECGVPFCQSSVDFGTGVSGCPLYNLIPEWNDAVYRDNLAHAISRLQKTNCFPEFTGRVCPALCEAACTCGMHDAPVTIKDNELYIIERAFEQGLMNPAPPTMRTDKKVAVVGAGPAGLAAADRLNKRGHHVTVFERDDRVGGLLMYGIPNMKLDKRVIDRRVKLMEQEGVQFVTNADVGHTLSVDKLMDEFDAVVLCTGAKQPRDLQVKGREAKGVHFAVDYLASTTKALLDNGLRKKDSYISAKGLDVVVVGGGDTGNDCVGTAIRHGCRSVVQIEMMPKLPDERTEHNPWPQWPRVCKTDYGQQEAIAVFGHDPRVYSTTVKELVMDESGQLKQVCTVQVRSAQKDGKMVLEQVEGSEQVLPAQLLLIAAGFVGSQPYVAEAFSLEQDARGNLAGIEGGHCTQNPKLFVAGDARRGQSLVVWAIAEGREAARAVDAFLMGYTELD